MNGAETLLLRIPALLVLANRKGVGEGQRVSARRKEGELAVSYLVDEQTSREREYVEQALYAWLGLVGTCVAHGPVGGWHGRDAEALRTQAGRGDNQGTLLDAVAAQGAGPGTVRALKSWSVSRRAWRCSSARQRATGCSPVGRWFKSSRRLASPLVV